MRTLWVLLPLLWAQPAFAEGAARVRILTASWCGGCGGFERTLNHLRNADGTLTVRVHGQERPVQVEVVSLDRTDPITLQSLRGKTLPGIQLVSASGNLISSRDGGEPNGLRAWVQQQLENESDGGIDWTPPVRNVATGEWAGRGDEARLAQPTSPISIPEKYRWILEDAPSAPGSAHRTPSASLAE